MKEMQENMKEDKEIQAKQLKETLQIEEKKMELLDKLTQPHDNMGPILAGPGQAHVGKSIWVPCV
jgi:hypothetical protein